MESGCDFCTLNESPSEKEGKSAARPAGFLAMEPSMKVPPKRKGNREVEVLFGLSLSPQ